MLTSFSWLSLCFAAVITSEFASASALGKTHTSASADHLGGATLFPVAGRSIDNGVELKIMPLGASIVFGTDSSSGNGFRLDLQNLLEADGNNVSYVGTVFHGNMTDNACEAYPGRTISQVNQLALQSGAYNYTPNVFLIHVGTNDCMAFANETAATAAGHFSDLLTTIQQQDKDALVVASTLIDNLYPSVEQCILDFNSRLPAVVQQAQSGGQKIVLVDMHAAVPQSDINTTDKTHPNDAGYAIMADVWYKGLTNASALISAPDSKGKAAPITPKSAASLKQVKIVLTLLAILLVVATVLG